MTDKNQKNKSKKKKVVHIVLVTFLIFFLFGVFQYFKFTKVKKARSATMETQRQIMINSWKEEGLSDEEIELRVQELSPKNASGERGSSSPLNMIRRVVTGRGQGGGFH
jgi:regulatory protein YycI of two-component signal transduction system YycFG